MGGRKLYPDPRFTLRYDREEKSNHINAFIQEACGKLLRQFGIVQHNRHNGVFTGDNVKTGCSHGCTEIFGIDLQFIP